MISELFKNPQDRVEILIIMGQKQYSFKQFVGEHFVAPMMKLGIKDFGKKIQTVQAFENANKKKPTKTELKPHITEILEHCDIHGIDFIGCVNPHYFTYLTGKKLENSIGSKLFCTIPGYEHIVVIPLLNPAVVRITPSKRGLLNRSINTMYEILTDTFVSEEFEFDSYEMVKNPDRAKELLDGLREREVIAWDIETTGLHHMTNQFITHGFAKDEKNAFTIVVHPDKIGRAAAEEMNKIVGDFLVSYTGKLLVHNVSFEGKWLAWKYWMKNYDDQHGIVDCFNHTKWEDSMLLSYALLNSTDRTSLGLKDLAQERYGDWDSDIDIKNAIDAPIDKLAYYNAIDVSATWYIWNKHKALITESQYEFYDVTMRKTQNLFLKLMLTGIPISMENVLSAKEELQEAIIETEKVFNSNPYVLLAENQIRISLAKKYNESHKVARKTPEDFDVIKFNYNSGNQVRLLLFDLMDYEPILFTDKGSPKTDRASIQEFLLSETDKDKKDVLESLIAFSQTGIILNTFLKSFENDSIEVEPGVFRLYGNYKNGGTQTFRPTANNPNLLNAPSGSKYGKLIKKCFKARPGFIIGSSDHASLQGRTAANLTKDANLIRLYNDDIDMHSFHATRYWPDEFPDFQDTVEYYASVKNTHEEVRNRSKGPTFLMQFGGGPQKLARTLKCPQAEADAIFYAYHNELYPDMKVYNTNVGLFAEQNGYVELGLGLRLLCPSVKSYDEQIKSAALRSVANATVQFWDVLTLIGIEKFQKHIEESGYIGRVVMHSTIYDSVYMEIENTPEVIQWVNLVLIKDMVEDYMENQPVKLKANLDITEEEGTWADLVELPNVDSLSQIYRMQDGNDD